MVPTNILQRTFHIQYNGSTGTCFTIECDQRQYIVTAAHVVKGISPKDTIALYHENDWKSLDITVVGIASPPADTAILAADLQLSPTYSLGTDTANMILGQDVYFLGFPYGLKINIEAHMNRGFPLPLVKKGIVSSMEFWPGTLEYLLLDGHNNPGFSGGPVFYTPPHTQNYKVAGVISGY